MGQIDAAVRGLPPPPSPDAAGRLALAREQLLALLARLEVGDEIPQDMYTAVAVILSWVYWLKGMRPGDEKVATQPD